MSVEIKDGDVYNLAQMVARKIGRRIRIFRDTKPGFTVHPGKGIKTPQTIRYSIVVENVPQIFGNMTINECKSRLAMILDLIYAGAIHGTTEAAARGDREGNSAPERAGGAGRGPGDDGGEVGRDAGGDAGLHKLADNNDSY